MAKRWQSRVWAASCAVALWLVSGPVHACSCRGGPSAAAALAKSAAVFEGEVEAVESIGQHGVRVTLRVLRRWKGASAALAILESNPRHPCSRVTFELKRRYLVYADATGAREASSPLAVGPCSRTTSAQGAEREMTRLDELQRRAARKRD